MVGFDIVYRSSRPYFVPAPHKGIVAIDVDQVLANLFVTWLDRYNRDYNDNLQASDIVEWEIEKFVKPKCGPKIYDYLNEASLYDEVPVIEGALEGVHYIKTRGYRVIYATSCYLGMHDAKWRWLVNQGFLPEKNTQYDLVSLSDKSLIRADIMIDDRPKHIEGFIKAGGFWGLLFDAPHNHDSSLERMYDWSEIVRHF